MLVGNEQKLDGADGRTPQKETVDVRALRSFICVVRRKMETLVDKFRN